MEIAMQKNLTVGYKFRECLLSLSSEHLPFCLLSKNVNIELHNTIILYVALYGCETWSLTSRRGHTLKKFENRALGRIFGPRKK
jgi:hypothetical protein